VWRVAEAARAMSSSRETIQSDPFLDAKAAAEYLGLTAVVRHPGQAVRALARKRRLRSAKLAGKVMFRLSWLDEYIDSNTREPVNLESRNRPPQDYGCRVDQRSM
jgi:hypothetical protein